MAIDHPVAHLMQADPDNDLTFAYVCNRCEGRRWQTTRNRRLLEALTTALRS